MNKKLLISLSIIIAAIFVSGATYADDLKEALELYLNDPSLDFLGHEFEDILFKESQQAFKGMKLNDAEFKAKLKFVLDDIKTLWPQAKAYHKIFTNKINAIAYGSLAGLWGSKVALGGEELAKIIFKIIKLGIR